MTWSRETLWNEKKNPYDFLVPLDDNLVSWRRVDWMRGPIIAMQLVVLASMASKGWPTRADRAGAVSSKQLRTDRRARILEPLPVRPERNQ